MGENSVGGVAHRAGNADVSSALGAKREMDLILRAEILRACRRVADEDVRTPSNKVRC
jgi:hypothetical protein